MRGDSIIFAICSTDCGRVLTCARLAAALMSDIYEDHKDEDGFLYITYSGENTFG